MVPPAQQVQRGLDLVPAWVNPALVILPLLAAACLAVAVRLAIARRRTSLDRVTRS